MQLPKYSIGVGDRFAHQGLAQLDAMILAHRQGVAMAPVWNKSHREHTITRSRPADVRAAADHAVKSRGWNGPYFVDADHVGLNNVDPFLGVCDFFTLDVADSIGADAGRAAIDAFMDAQQRLIGTLKLPGLARSLTITQDDVAAAARRFLAAIGEAGRIYRHITNAYHNKLPVIEVSLDETDRPQTPTELLLILAMIAAEDIPAQTIAPRFVGRFNKGVNYVGDPREFRRQFEEGLAVVAIAVEELHLPKNLKLSVHSGSDKFALYRPMREAMQAADAGIHLKTAGTTWLEEVIGLAMAGGDGPRIVKDIYRQAWARWDELCAPYASVIDIDRQSLPSPEQVDRWDGAELAAALRHDSTCEKFNPNLRQLMHVAYRIAAEMGRRFTDALEKHAEVIGANVTANLFDRHIRPLFLGEDRP